MYTIMIKLLKNIVKLFKFIIGKMRKQMHIKYCH